MMEVILIDDVFEVGRRGQIVSVADGFRSQLSDSEAAGHTRNSGESKND